MPRILAIDYGTKRVGLAVTDPMQIIASSLTTVHSKDVIQYLKDYTAKEEVSCFVVGKPTRHNGDDTDATPHIEKFISLLVKNFLISQKKTVLYFQLQVDFVIFSAIRQFLTMAFRHWYISLETLESGIKRAMISLIKLDPSRHYRSLSWSLK
jgi:RNase H-fold protein (predicted Holliday junction resolvase)